LQAEIISVFKTGESMLFEEVEGKKTVTYGEEITALEEGFSLLTEGAKGPLHITVGGGRKKKKKTTKKSNLNSRAQKKELQPERKEGSLGGRSLVSAKGG